MKRNAVCFAAIALLASNMQFSACAADSKPNDEAAIKKIENDWINAIVKRDAAYLQKIEADDYVFTGPDGKALTKAEDIKSDTTGDVVFDDFKIDNLKVRFYGDTAIVNGIGTVKAHEKEEDLSGQYSWTDVFAKQKGEWKAVSAHVTVVASGSPED
jgi:ketosteroid isomerase-like protein